MVVTERNKNLIEKIKKMSKGGFFCQKVKIYNVVTGDGVMRVEVDSRHRSSQLHWKKEEECG